MRKQIVGTSLVRYLGTVTGFVIVLLTAKFFGASGRGQISLLVTDIMVIMMLNNFVGGAGLVYLTPRNDSTSLWAASTIWALFVSLICASVIIYFSLVPVIFKPHLFAFALLQALLTLHLFLFLGKENYKAYNYASLAQHLLLVFTFLGLSLTSKEKSITHFIIAEYASFGGALVLAFIMTKNSLQFPIKTKLKDTYNTCFRYGFYIQLSNVLQILNYRLCFYFLNHLSGTAQLGVYSVAMSIAEALLIISKIIAMVQYSRISNSTEDHTQNTIQLAKVSFIIAFSASLCILITPVGLYSMVFGKDFSTVKNILTMLSVGVCSYAFGVVYSHHFSGEAKNVHNLIASLLGLVVTIIGAIIFIPIYHAYGAAITASLSFFVSSVYLIFTFKKLNNANLTTMLFELQQPAKSLVSVLKSRLKR